MKPKKNTSPQALPHKQHISSSRGYTLTDEARKTQKHKDAQRRTKTHKWARQRGALRHNPVCKSGGGQTWGDGEQGGDLPVQVVDLLVHVVDLRVQGVDLQVEATALGIISSFI